MCLRRNARSLCADSPVSACPATSARPAVGRSWAARMRSSELLPEPDGPVIAVSRPAGTTASTPLSACTSPLGDQ